MKGVLFGSASVEGGSLPESLERACDRATDALKGRMPDIAFAFVSPTYGSEVATAGRRLRERTNARHVIGCTGLGVCETAGEIDGRPALSVLVGSLPGVEL